MRYTLGGCLLAAIIAFVLMASGCAHRPKGHGEASFKNEGVKPGAAEKHFKSLRQLTFEGTNAEGYFSPDGKKIIYQGHTPAQACDQVYVMSLDGSERKLISAHGGRNTCSFFISPDKILYSSTMSAGAGCPKERDRSKGYVWEIFKSYDIYNSKIDGTDFKPLTTTDGYDAESTVCGGKITFTSARENQSLNIYTMNLDGTGVERLTHETGYNGGPFFSPDCTQIVYRAYHPTQKSEIKKFKRAVSLGYVPPSPLELFVMNADGGDKRQLTAFGAASFAPSFYPHAEKIIFSSNFANKSKKERIFQLYAVPTNAKLATEAEAISAEGTFNGFPMFSPDGKYLIFASNRNSSNPHELQLFLAEWQD